MNTFTNGADATIKTLFREYDAAPEATQHTPPAPQTGANT